MSGGGDDFKNVALVNCVCGGWVMIAAMGHNPESDADTYKEIARMVRRGFTPQHMTLSDYRANPPESCEYRGDCTTNPEKIRRAKEAAAAQQGDVFAGGA